MELKYCENALFFAFLRGFETALSARQSIIHDSAQLWERNVLFKEARLVTLTP